MKSTHIALVLIQILIVIPAFGFTWDKDVIYLCTDPKPIGGPITGMVLPKGSELFQTLMDVASAANISRSTSSCSRTVNINGDLIQSTGKQCTLSENLGGFRVDLLASDLVVGKIKSNGSLEYVEFDASKTFSYDSILNDTPYASGSVTHVCRRIVNGQPLGEMMVEFQKAPNAKTQYLRMRTLQ